MDHGLSTYQTQNRGLNGRFFRWLGRALVATFNSGIEIAFGGGLLSVIRDFTNGDGQFGGQQLGSLIGEDIAGFFGLRPGLVEFETTDLPLTNLDEANLDNWLNNSFIPYFNLLLKQIKDISLSTATVQEVADVYNNIHLHLGFIRWYVVNTNTNSIATDLSTNATKTRNTFLRIQKTILEEQLNTYLDRSGVVIVSGFKSNTLNGSVFQDLGLQLPNTITLSSVNAIKVNGVLVVTNTIPDNTNNNPNDTITIPNNEIPAPTKDKNNIVLKATGLIVVGWLANTILSNNN